MARNPATSHLSTPARVIQGVGGVPQGLGRDLSRHLGQSNGRFIRGRHGLKWSAVPLDEMLARNPFGRPTTKMSPIAEAESARCC